MTYLNAVKYILSLPSGNDCFTDPALHERMHSVASRLGDPQKQIKFIHVCGDVGKGSCSAMLDSILGHMSYKRGLFSYHDGDDPRSTIIMDGRQASYDEFTGAVSLIKNTYKELFGQLLPYAEEAMTQVKHILTDLENTWSATSEDSLLSHINAGICVA